MDTISLKIFFSIFHKNKGGISGEKTRNSIVREHYSSSSMLFSQLFQMGVCNFNVYEIQSYVSNIKFNKIPSDLFIIFPNF